MCDWTWYFARRNTQSPESNLLDETMTSCRMLRNCTKDKEEERFLIGYNLTVNVVEMTEGMTYFRGVENCTVNPIYGAYDKDINTTFLFRERILLVDASTPLTPHGGTMLVAAGLWLVRALGWAGR